GLTQLELRNIRDVDGPLRLPEIRAALHRRFATLSRDPFEHGGLLPLKTSHAALTALVQSYPPAQRSIDEALGTRPNPIEKLSTEEQFAFQQQKDAVLMSLDLARLDRKEHLRADFNLDRPPKSFLEGLPQVTLREGAMLLNDLQNFPGFN